MTKVVLDTNIFVSMLLGSDNCLKIRGAFLNNLFDIILSEKLFLELIGVLKRPKFRNLIHKDSMRELINLIETDLHFVEPQVKISVCRDPDDNAILECAVAGNADFIITGDKDLLSLEEFKGISMVTAAEFLKYLKI